MPPSIFKPNPNLDKELAAEIGTGKRVVMVYIEDDDDKPPETTLVTNDAAEIRAWFNQNIPDA